MLRASAEIKSSSEKAWLHLVILRLPRRRHPNGRGWINNLQVVPPMKSILWQMSATHIMHGTAKVGCYIRRPQYDGNEVSDISGSKLKAGRSIDDHFRKRWEALYAVWTQTPLFYAQNGPMDPRRIWPSIDHEESHQTVIQMTAAGPTIPTYGRAPNKTHPFKSDRDSLAVNILRHSGTIHHRRDHGDKSWPNKNIVQHLQNNSQPSEYRRSPVAS